MKVKVNSVYIYHANLLDRCDGRTGLLDGTLVTVANRHGCPPANTMGHCYVDDGRGRGGLVSTNSLHTKADYIRYLRERIGTHSDNPRNKAATPSVLHNL